MNYGAGGDFPQRLAKSAAQSFGRKDGMDNYQKTGDDNGKKGDFKNEIKNLGSHKFIILLIDSAVKGVNKTSES